MKYNITTRERPRYSWHVQLCCRDNCFI